MTRTVAEENDNRFSGSCGNKTAPGLGGGKPGAGPEDCWAVQTFITARANGASSSLAAADSGLLLVFPAAAFAISRLAPRPGSLLLGLPLVIPAFREEHGAKRPLV